MENYDAWIASLALVLGASWASGLNLYAVLFILGLGGAAGHIPLPQGLEILQSPALIVFAAIMYCVEFFTDKMPNVDAGWDALHTFVRIPGGALLAAGVMNESTELVQLSAGLLGAYIATVTHAMKSGSRGRVNAIATPWACWATSVSEDLLVLASIWCAINRPMLCLILVLVFVSCSFWMLPQVWRALAGLFSRVGRLFVAGEPAATPSK